MELISSSLPPHFVDFLGGYGTLPFGFNPPEIWQAVTKLKEAEEPVFIIPSLLEGAGELAEKLVQLFPPMRFVWFANSGTEAVEAAIKLARSSTGRKGLIIYKTRKYLPTHLKK